MQDLANMFPGDCQPLKHGPAHRNQRGEAQHPHTACPRCHRHRQPAQVFTYEGAGMKRSLVAPTAGAAAILLTLAAGCSSSGNSGGSASSGSSSGSSSSGKSYKMTFIQGVAGDGFYVTMACGMQAAAKKLGQV